MIALSIELCLVTSTSSFSFISKNVPSWSQVSAWIYFLLNDEEKYSFTDEVFDTFMPMVPYSHLIF